MLGKDVGVGQINDEWNLYAKAKDGRITLLCNRYGWSEHNCNCKKSKTGLILYPIDRNYKNIVLLVCQDCYGYKSGQGTQHEQLCKWYYGIYGDSKAFALVSGFAQKDDGSFGYNSSTYNEKIMYGDVDYGDGKRYMNELEQRIVQEVVTNKRHSYNVAKAISQGNKNIEITMRNYIFCLDPALFKCSNGHTLKLSEHKDRKTESNQAYNDEGFSCDACKTKYSSGVSWHCSCHLIGFDKCRKCVSSKG